MAHFDPGLITNITKNLTELAELAAWFLILVPKMSVLLLISVITFYDYLFCLLNLELEKND